LWECGTYVESKPTFPDNEETRKSNWYFEKSKVLRFRILSYFNKLLIEENDVIEEEIKGNTPATPSGEDNAKQSP